MPYTLLAERYERSSVMLTSNLPFSQWKQIFKDPMTMAAMLHRFTLWPRCGRTGNAVASSLPNC